MSGRKPNSTSAAVDCCRVLFAHVVEELFGDDVADAVGRAAITGIALIIFEIEAVVEGEFLPCPDVLKSRDPNVVAA